MNMSLKAIRQYLETYKSSGIDGVFHHQAISQVLVENLSKSAILAELEEKYSTCTKCKLHSGRIKFVYGDGNPDTTVMIIGEGPGEQENLQGKPFVGKAGELLTKMLMAIEIKREDVYIANIVKCRPPDNRNPEADERLACLPFLIEQIGIIQPKLFLLMGLVAAQTLLDSKDTMGSLRVNAHHLFNIPTYVTYHPAALLRNPEWKKPAWEDLQRFQAHYRQICGL